MISLMWFLIGSVVGAAICFGVIVVMTTKWGRS